MKIPFGKPFPGIDSVSLKDGVASGLVNGFINETAVDVESIPGQGLRTTLSTTTETFGIGTARHFNGINDYLLTPITNDSYNGFTWYSWVKRDATGTRNGLAGRLFSTTNGWAVYIDQGNLLTFQHDNFAAIIPSPDLSVWTFLAVTYDGSLAGTNVHWYAGTNAANIVEIGNTASSTGSFTELGTYGAMIGNITFGPSLLNIDAWNGYLDQPAYYYAPLTLAQLQAACLPESIVSVATSKLIAHITGEDPEPALMNSGTPQLLTISGTTVHTGPAVGAANAAPSVVVVTQSSVDALYETLNGVVLAVSDGHVFIINSDGTSTPFEPTSDLLIAGNVCTWAEDGQHVYVAHGGKLARLDMTNLTVELLNENTPSNVTHVARAKGFLHCNGNEVVVTSSQFDLSQVFDNASSLYAVAVLYDKPGWMVACGQGTFNINDHDGRLYHSRDNGITWHRIYSIQANAQFNAIAYMGGGVVLAGSAFTTGNIFRSTDYGMSWFDLGQMGSTTNINFIKKLTDTVAIAGTGDGAGLGRVFRSTDTGQTWTDLGVDFGKQVSDGEAMTASGTVVDVATISNIDTVRLWRSVDTGATFLMLSQDFNGAAYVPFIQRITDLIAVMSNGFITGNQKIWRSMDQGANWTEIGPIPDFPEHSMPWCACQLEDGSIIMGTAGDNLGIGGAQLWKSIDQGLTWFLLTVLEDFQTAAVQWHGLAETHVAGTIIATGRIAEGRDGTATAAKWQTAVGKNLPQGDVFYSEVPPYEAVDSWERFNAESVPDKVNGVFSHRGLVYACGPRSIEINYSSGDAEFPWAVSDPSLPYGLIAPNSWVSWDELDTVMYLTSTDKGIKVVQLRSRQQQGISEEYDQVLNDRTVITQPQDAKAWAITIRGLRFYVITFQADNLTLLYNLQQDHWARWAYWNGTTYEAALINAYCYSSEQKRHFFGDRRPTGKVFTMELTDLTDDGNPILFEYTSGHISRGGDSAKFPARYLGRYKRGYSIDATVPEVLLSWRDDGRGPFSTERLLLLGATGDNEFYVHANRLGMYRLRQWRQRAFLSKCRLIFSGADES